MARLEWLYDPGSSTVKLGVLANVVGVVAGEGVAPEPAAADVPVPIIELAVMRSCEKPDGRLSEDL